MVGKYDIEVITNKIKYKLTVNRNITVIRGNSSSGKSELCRLIEKSFKTKAVKIKSSVDIDIISRYEGRLEQSLKEIDNKIILIDESSIIFEDKNLAELLKNSNNYFILITRDKLGMLPYSYKEIYELKYEDGWNVMKRVYEDYVENNIVLYNKEAILVEDSKSGLQLYREIFDNNSVITSKGKSNIVNILKTDNIKLIIADGSAIGPEIEDILNSIRHKNINLFLPESVEYVILNAKLFNRVHTELIGKIMNNLSQNIDSKHFFSWEIFFTSLLEKISSEYPELKYSKLKLKSWYFNDVNKSKILKSINKSVRLPEVDMNWF